MSNFHLMAKPVGALCNLKCTYCFYLEKAKLYPASKLMMSDEILETYIKQYIASQDGQLIEFTWQGGEPTLAGLDFYKKAIKYQNQYGRDKQISNSLQTNGTLLSDEWCRFLNKHNFLVGLSLDGPERLHNHNRKMTDGKNTHKMVMEAVKLMKKYGVEFNVLTTVNNMNVKEPLMVYNYYLNMGIQYVQFIPIVERMTHIQLNENESRLARPNDDEPTCALTEWSVEPEPYGDFLISVFNRWVRHDIGRIFIMNFEWALSAAIYGVSGTCHYANTCGRAAIIEHNGDIYACDHFVYPEYKIGNILEDDLKEVMRSNKQVAFGKMKSEGLSDTCMTCDVLSLCYGGCPKHRFNEGKNYLCKGLKKFFTHIRPYALEANKLIQQGRPLTDLMEIAKQM